MVTSKLSSRVRTSIIEGRGEVVFFAEQSSATRRADRKRRRFFAMAVVAGIQWEDRFYSGLNPVMPARVASRSHSRTRSRCHASVCVRVRERVGRCRSLAPPRNGRCRCRCLSLSLRLLSFLFPTLSLSPLYFLLFFLYLPLFSPLSLSFPFHLGRAVVAPLLRTTFGLGTRKRRGKFRKAKKYALAGYYYTDGS